MAFFASLPERVRQALFCSQAVVYQRPVGNNLFERIELERRLPEDGYFEIYDSWETFLRDAVVNGSLSVHCYRFYNEFLLRVGDVRINSRVLQGSVQTTLPVSASDILEWLQMKASSVSRLDDFDEWMREWDTHSQPMHMQTLMVKDFQVRTDNDLRIDERYDENRPWWDCKYAPQWYKHSALNEWAVQRTHFNMWKPVQGMLPVCRPLYVYNVRLLKLRARPKMRV